jgi:hypothetical protein
MKSLPLSFNTNAKNLWVLTFLFTVIMIVDSIIVAIYADIPREPTYAFHLTLFISFVIFFIVMNYILLNYSRQNNMTKGSKKQAMFRGFYVMTVLNQFAIIVVLLLVIIELLAFSSYHTATMIAVVYLSHIPSITCLAFLAYVFIRWFNTNRNYLFLIYGCGFAILILSIFISLLFLSFELSYYQDIIKVRSIKRQVSDSSIPTINLVPLIKLYDYISIASFVSIWIPTVILMKTYSKSLGNILYWTLVVIPLLYFLFPFLATEFDIFEKTQLEQGKQFSFIYTIFVSPYKQVGGILFGLVFLTTAMKVRRENLRKLMMISSIGMTLLFGSIVLHGMMYIVTPPFGLITLSVMGLGSYMLLMGLLISSKEIANDALVRRELYHIAEDQLHLIRNLGQTEMERAMVKKCKPIMDKLVTVEENNQQDLFDEEHYKEMIKEILNELKSRK